MEIRTSADGSRMTVAAVGDMDVDTAYDVYAATVGQPGHGEVALDLSGVDFIDSVGLSMLVRSRDELTDSGVQLILHSPSQAVERMLELTGMRSHFDVES